MFELKKDICTPNSYIKAGVKKTKEEWEKLYPHCFSAQEEWFIDLNNYEEKKDEPKIIWDIIDRIFTEKGLSSISYKQASVKACMEYKAHLRISNVI